MTRCPKCAGCYVPEIEDYPFPPTVRCINCSYRPAIQANPPVPEPVGRNGKRKGGAQLAGSTGRGKA